MSANFMSFKAPALILAGGLGTRLRAFEPHLPKPMVLICGEPFLFWLVKHLGRVGFERFIFSIGYKAEFIKNFPWKARFPDFEFEFIEEESPLGTGGATLKAFNYLKSHSKKAPQGLWVINGDTLITSPLRANVASPYEVIYAAMTGEQIFDAEPNLRISGQNVVEIKSPGDLFDAGQIYIDEKAVENYKGEVPCSIHALIADALKNKKVTYTRVLGDCYDIGTPERLKRFEGYLKSFVAVD